MNDFKKKLINNFNNFLEKNDKKVNELQQTCLNFLDTSDQHIDEEKKEEIKEKFKKIYVHKTYCIDKFCENIIYRQILIPVFKNKFFLLTDFAPVDHCFYQSTVEALFEKVKRKHDEWIDELINQSNQIIYSYKFESKNKLFDQIEKLTENNGKRYCLYLNISDFYPRIYQHRLENILRHYTKKQKFENYLIDTLITILNSVNKKQSYGIPIGPSCSEKLAEILLFSLDLEFLKMIKRIFIKILKNSSEKIIYYRYSDTYLIIFQKTDTETETNMIKCIKEFLSEIIEIFLKNYNFNLQSSKSEIIKLDDFLKKLNDQKISVEKIKNILQNDYQNENNLKIFYEEIHKIDNHQIIEIIQKLQINDYDHLMKLYKYFSYYQIHILDLYFRKIRHHLENLKKSKEDEKIKEILIFIKEKSNTNYKFYQLMIDHLIIDYGDEEQFSEIKIEKTIECFYYPNYLFKEFEKFPEPERFYSRRMAYTEFNTWEKIGYLILIPRMTRNTRNSEFNFIDFQNEKNTQPFLNIYFLI